ncbi:MAG: hypothetical protein RML56_08715 [Burkholderiales bacterium]|nr:hypothetical protein [Burkholderiales bacterium]
MQGDSEVLLKRRPAGFAAGRSAKVTERSGRGSVGLSERGKEIGGERKRSVGCRGPRASCAAAHDSDDLRDWLVERIKALEAEASERGGFGIFAQVLAWRLAVIAHAFGPAVTGDILRIFGTSLIGFEEHFRAEREAREALAQGRRPN